MNVTVRDVTDPPVTHIRRSLRLYKEFWHLDPCGQDIARTIQPRLLKLSMYT